MVSLVGIGSATTAAGGLHLGVSVLGGLGGGRERLLGGRSGGAGLLVLRNRQLLPILGGFT